MSDVIPFRKPTPKQKHKGKSLCRHGHHKWLVDKEKQFDVRRGELVTVYRCARCDKVKVKTH